MIPRDCGKDARPCVSTVIDSTLRDLYKNKYRIESARLKGWDYSSPGYYFITIVTKNREHWFGQIVDGKMNLSEIGEIAEQYWAEIPCHFPFVKLDEYIVMPNHIHGIIIIENTVNHDKSVESVETQNLASLRSTVSNVLVSNFGPQSKNIASIIRGFKIGVTKYATNNNIPFKWQPRFYDHIIRDNDLNRIRQYMLNNPLNWEMDDNNQKEVTP